MVTAPADDAAAPRPRGRRAGTDTRAEILAAAEAEYTERGYAATSVRGIARRAGVDPALVRYWFPGGKPELLASSLADRRVDPVRIVTGLIEVGLEGLGGRLLETVLSIWDQPGGPERFRMIFGAAATGADTLAHDFLATEVFSRVAAAVPGPDAVLRVHLLASHVLGVLTARYVLRLEPVVRATPAELAARVGPVLDAYLLPPRAPAAPC